MTEWLSLVQTFGLAVTILFFIGVCLWRASGWLGENVVKPIVNRYLILLDSLIASVAKQGEAMVKVGAILEKLGQSIDSMGGQTVKFMATFNRVAEIVGRSNCTNFREGDPLQKDIRDIRESGHEHDLGGRG